MIQTNSGFDAKNAAPGKKPIYALVIGSQPTVYTTHDLVAEGITGTLPSYRTWLKTPRGASQSIDVLNGSSSIGELECEVVDQNGELRALVGTTTLEGSSAVLRTGYPGMAWTDFVALHTYQIYKVRPNKGYTGWLFTSRDPQLLEKRTIWQNPENGKPLEDTNPWILQGTPSEILQAVWLFGLELPLSGIDRAALDALDSASKGRPFQFSWTDPLEAKQFLETEIFKVCGMYPLVTNDGKLSARTLGAPASGAVPLFTFDQNNCTLLPEIDRQPIVNQIIFRIDDDGSGNYQNELFYIDGDSVSTYGRASQQVIESKGLRTAWGAQWFCEEVADRLFRRFAGTPLSLRGGAPLYKVNAFLLTLPVWVGDYVNLSHPLMPDLFSGALGVTNRLVEVIDREPDYARGQMQFTLLDTGLTGQPPAAQYDSAVIGAAALY